MMIINENVPRKGIGWGAKPPPRNGIFAASKFGFDFVSF